MSTNASATGGGLRRTASSVVAAITDHHSLLLASGIAFTAAMGVIPALVTIVATYGLVATPADVEANVANLTDPLPAPAADLIISELQALTAADRTSVTIGLVIGVAASIYAISSVVNAAVMTVRVAHEQPSPHTWVQGRLFALRLSLIAVATTATGLWLIVALPRTLDRVDLTTELGLVIDIIRWPVAFILSNYAVALLYRVVAGQQGAFFGVSLGAFTATAIWILSTAALGLAYDHVDRLQNAFTTFGAVAALLIWFYLSAVAIVIGAEVDHARRRSSTESTATA